MHVQEKEAKWSSLVAKSDVRERWKSNESGPQKTHIKHVLNKHSYIKNVHLGRVGFDRTKWRGAQLGRRERADSPGVIYKTFVGLKVCK